MGKLVAPKNTLRRESLLFMTFGALPDLFQIPLYLFVGYMSARPYFFPLTEDWEGIRDSFPSWMLLWELPHSLLFALFIIFPLIYIFNLPLKLILAYVLHIVVDIFTHSGEWSVKPFFPYDLTIEGFTDAWSWNPLLYPVSWLVILSIGFVLHRPGRLQLK